ncbi:MAG: RHS repeat-associated core domain-containing protein [Hydrococcus sp. SU_1_0]|nr:RHS repeat-associated core domain-containing protein [Hydrococcus sp. SU_1_0]
MVNSYFYDPFGDDISETEGITNPFEFVGQYGVAEEANGLDFMRARFYDSDTGRFISPDPIGLLGNDLNLYRYVQNSPNNYIDPEGLFGIIPDSLKTNYPNDFRYRDLRGEQGQEYVEKKRTYRFTTL